jgi:MFS family permease
LLFKLGSVICGAVLFINALIIRQVICGVAGSGIYVGVMTLLAATTTIHKRPMYISGTGLT